MRPGRLSFVLAAAFSLYAVGAAAEPVKFERPRSLMALLMNMKRAAEEGLLLDEKFYAADSLEQAFGGSFVAYDRPVANMRIGGSLSGFGVLFEPVRVAGGGAREGARLEFRLSSAGPRGSLRLSIVKPTVAFDAIEAAFGKGWAPAPYAQPDGSPPAYSARLHGSSSILYNLGSANLARSIAFAFNPRALLEAVTATGG
jgi:hypothetical protein